MDLPLFYRLASRALALTLYGLLDGFDLGVGTLLLLRRSDSSRDHMIDSITPTWDGNETWLVMTGITLFTAFPTAYAILMPAFYLAGDCHACWRWGSVEWRLNFAYR
jgi:cytochrome d ubiquinol oxidase subunit II